MTLRHLPLALLLIPAEALAVDLDELLVAWTNTETGQGGSGADEIAKDVVITGANEIFVVGQLDGAAGHGTDGFAVNYNTNGTIDWTVTKDAGAVGSDLLASDDTINSLELDPLSGALAWCGSFGRADPDGTFPNTGNWFWIDVFDPITPNNLTPPVRRAIFDPDSTGESIVFARDGSNSFTQSCEGLDYTNDIISGTGWSEQPTSFGRWYTTRYQELDATRIGIPFYHNGSTVNPSFAVPDQAFGIDRRSVDDYLAVVGAEGVTGVEDGPTNDTDWHVKVYDGALDEIWSESLDAGDSNLEDVALDVLFDPRSGLDQVYVVGFENGGSNNTNLSDRNWLVRAYEVDGDGDGNASLATAPFRFGVDSNADEVATAITLDDEGNLLVVGSTRDETSGMKSGSSSNLRRRTSSRWPPGSARTTAETAEPWRSPSATTGSLWPATSTAARARNLRP